MNCTKCGNPLDADAKFCDVCGTPVENGNTGAFAQQQTPFQQTPFSEAQTGGSPFGGAQTGGPQFGGPQFGGAMSATRRGMDCFDVDAGFNTKRIRKWFGGEKPKLPVIFPLISIIGLLCAWSYDGRPSMGMMLCVMIFGAIWIVTWMASGSVQEVNDAWRTYVDILSKRGMEKLNLIQEEVNLIDPVVLVGCGERPNNSFENSRTEEVLRMNIFSRIFRLFTKKLRNEYDPEERYRVDYQDYLHSMLLQVSVYMFSGEQVYGYFGNVDISTGLIYKEYTAETFYEDIDAVKFDQEVIKVYSARRKCRVNKVIESFVLYLAGCKFSSRVLLEANDSSVVDQQLSGMRNLIRDKKKSAS